jgi:predicted RNA binding protein with dsRBD fold (UPF0201 family)
MDMARSPEEELELDGLETNSAPPGLDGITVVAVAPLYGTEDSSAVGSAILSIFPGMDLEVADGHMTGRATGLHALARFRRRIREMRIRDTARSQLGRGSGPDCIDFVLNKQSAFARVPNFSTGGAPLGDINVTISASEPEVVLEWLCELDED